MSVIYPTDLSDAEWECLNLHLPAKRPRGRPCGHPLRAILDAIFYLLRTGCPWRGRPLGSMPRDFPPWQTVYYHFRRFRLDAGALWAGWHHILTSLRTAERRRVGKEAQPSAAIMDAQSIKIVEESASISGYDGHKRVKGRKRPLLVDTLGLPISIYVTPADVHDQVGARCLLAGLKPLVPRLQKIWADGAYAGKELARWCREYGGWEVEIVGRDPAAAVDSGVGLPCGQYSRGWCAIVACASMTSGRCRQARPCSRWPRSVSLCVGSRGA